MSKKVPAAQKSTVLRSKIYPSTQKVKVEIIFLPLAPV